MIAALKDRLRAMTPKQKRSVFLGAGLALVLALGWAITGKKSQDKAAADAKALGPKQVRLDPEVLRRSAYDEQRRELVRLQKELSDLRTQVTQPAPGVPGVPAVPGTALLPPLPNAVGVVPSPVSFTPPAPVPERKRGRSTRSDPPPLPLPPLPGGGLMPPPPFPTATGDAVSTLPGPGGLSPSPAPLPPGTRPQGAAPQKPPTEMVGGIATFPNSDTAGKSSSGKGTGKAAGKAQEGSDPSPGEENGGDQKKKARGPGKEDPLKVYLPPSILPAKLLTGLDASTTGGGKGNPEPVLLRVQAPAILPNAVRANLRGCFIVAEGAGRLDKERIDVRLLSLNCIDKGGHAVIATKIKGFVTDEDGKGGLSAHVVSKMGAASARAFLAGGIKGIGDAFSSSSMSQSVSPLGATQIVDTGALGRAALGGGVSKGIEPLLDLYVDLAKQAAPVLEKIPGANVTAIVTEGVDLDIQLYDRRIGGGS